MEWQTKGKGRKIQNPVTNVAERALLEGYRLGLSKGKMAEKGAGKGQYDKSKGKTDLPKWTCTFCMDQSAMRHSWCNGCGMHYLDAAHSTEETMTGSKQNQSKGKGKDADKGKGKGSKSSGRTGAGTAKTPSSAPPAAPAEETRCLHPPS